jgi:hypothetical protein
VTWSDLPTNLRTVLGAARLVTGVPPVAGIFMTLLLAFLVKVLALALGKPLQYHAPAAQVAHLAPPQTTVVQLPDGAYGQPPVYGQMPTWAPSQIRQTRQPVAAGELGEATKRRQVETYLATLSPDQLGRLAGVGPRPPPAS